MDFRGGLFRDRSPKTCRRPDKFCHRITQEMRAISLDRLQFNRPASLQSPKVITLLGYDPSATTSRQADQFPRLS